MNVRLFSLAILIILPFPTFGMEPKQLAEDFIQSLGTDHQDEAMENLFSTNSAAFMQKGRQDKMKLEISQMVRGGGKFSGADLLAEKQLGERMIGLTYLLRFNRSPIRFEFVFYKPDDRWMILKFSTRSGLADEIVEAMRDEVRKP